ncbi:polynucleotide 3'-phosphatase ZDP isoform X2 [Tripterygium wilfordii]|uniref:polynucleotide 3'-phosphatase ZDP isoform X2 n=1 Tax=Tripterygium wilfordii TaxID=458696 RepID=UPI0018F8602E|nr:polynucleotide 3'-phosphatase ZDP isoform X2 [Tripterygium wilfordii]
MLTISALGAPSCNPNIFYLYNHHFHCFSFHKVPNRFFRFGFHSSSTAMPPSSASKIVAEYAKSNRSSCKKCAKAIASKTLRLGIVTKDSRGFDLTKWHHLDCFSDPVESVDSVSGFDSLRGSDQEALKKLVDGQKRTLEEKTNEDREEFESDKRSAKKIKPCTPHEEAKLEVRFLISDVKDKYKEDGLRDSQKIAAFDFDGCLAKTSVKRVGQDAWSLMYPSIPSKLQSLYDEGYKLVIFTNESNIDRWKNKRQVAVDSKLGRLSNFIKQVKVPIQVFVACGYDNSDGSQDPFRKPEPGMWRIMEKHFNSDISINMDQSFYVGDAAGRPNDHSDADLKFAQTIGLKFYVPEEYFGAE